VITGRGPGAPGVTPGLEFTRRRVTAGGPGSQAVDLSEIRRSEEAMNVLAARGAGGPEMLHDPALALLSALSADVDSPSTIPQRGPARAGNRRLGEAWEAMAGAPSRGAAAWLRAAVAGAVVAGLAGTTTRPPRRPGRPGPGWLVGRARADRPARPAPLDW
jgi:hypothetical protein